MAAMREPLNMTARNSSLPSTTTIQHPHSAWHSPVPYLFGGLAAMLGLIAFALLILACSYWKLSGFLDGGEGGNGDNNGNGQEEEVDLEAGVDGKGGGAGKKGLPSVWEEKILVIMAGDVKPTFLATPMSSRSSSFGDNKSSSSSSSSSDGSSESVRSEKAVEMEERDQNGERHEDSDRTH